MARIPMVTRTIKSTEVEVLVANLETKQVSTKSIELAGTYKNEKVLMKALESHSTESERIITVKNSTVHENLYGMEEQEFLKLAKILPPRDSKEVE